MVLFWATLYAPCSTLGTATPCGHRPTGNDFRPEQRLSSNYCSADIVHNVRRWNLDQWVQAERHSFVKIIEIQSENEMYLWRLCYTLVQKKQIWHKGSRGRHNRVSFFSKSIKGFSVCQGPKMRVFHWLWRAHDIDSRPYNRCCLWFVYLQVSFNREILHTLLCHSRGASRHLRDWGGSMGGPARNSFLTFVNMHYYVKCQNMKKKQSLGVLRWPMTLSYSKFKRHGTTRRRIQGASKQNHL